MRTLRTSLPAVTVFALFATLAEPAPPPHSGQVVARCGERIYTFETIDPPFGTPGVDMVVEILWMNNSGVVTAAYQMPPDPNYLVNMHAAVLQRGRWTNIDVPGAISSGPSNANNRGQTVLGYQMLPDGPWHAGLYDRHGLHPFPDLPDYPGGILVQGLNDLDQIAAVVIDAAGSWHGFVGDIEDHAIVDYPDATATMPMGLNNHGTAVGYSFLPDAYPQGFWYKDGDLRAFDRPGSIATIPCAINNSGVIVGISAASEAAGWDGFLLERGRYADVRVPNATYTNPYFINDRGQISGIYADAAGVVHGFVATPVRGDR